MDKFITNHSIHFDDKVQKQFNDCISYDFVIKASLMPDAHSGYVAPIGSVIVTSDFIIPSWVGYDIGCGMIAVKFSCKNIYENILRNKYDIFKIVNKIIPMGKGIYNDTNNISKKTKDNFNKLLNDFQKVKNYDKNDFNMISSDFSLSNIGSLGSGNHFIELNFDEDKNIWLVIHSGSRKIGHNLATKYMKLSQKINNAKNAKGNFEKTYPFNINTNEGKNYINALNFCLEYALLNRLEIAYKVHSTLETLFNQKISFELYTNKNHNHAIFENNLIIHRKGATPAKKKEKGIIPGNMRDGSFLVEGLGNKDFLESSSHGAGRVFSRKESKRNINLDEFKDSMKGIIANVSDKTIDESPFAYKNISEIMSAQKNSVKIISHLKPIINWKG